MERTFFLLSYIFLQTGAALCLLLPDSKAIAGQPTSVILSKAVEARFSESVEALGTLRANESVEITSTVTDTITAIHFEDGQGVAKGDILVEMTSLEEHAQLEEALSTVAEAEKQYGRLKNLVASGATARSLLDEQQREFDTAKARLGAINSRLKDRLIVAPFSGTLGLRDVSVGALIEPGDVITTLDDNSVMKLDFTLPSVHLAALQLGMPIEARTSAFPEKIFTGTVSSINSRIDPVTRAVAVRAIVANPDRLLRPGLLMQVVLEKNSRSGVKIPEEALIPVGKDNYVFVVNPQAATPMAERRQVRLGIRQQGRVEIAAGLEAGEFVITHGTIKVKNGQEVAILAEEQGDEPLAELLSQKRERSTP